MLKMLNLELEGFENMLPSKFGSNAQIAIEE